MELYQGQQTYKILGIIWALMIPWNLFIAMGAAITNQIAQFPEILKNVLWAWIIVSVAGVVFSGLTIQGSSIVKSNRFKLFIMAIMTISSLLPTLVAFLISN
jgi:hypothetical protein